MKSDVDLSVEKGLMEVDRLEAGCCPSEPLNTEPSLFQCCAGTCHMLPLIPLSMLPGLSNSIFDEYILPLEISIYLTEIHVSLKGLKMTSSL